MRSRRIPESNRESEVGAKSESTISRRGVVAGVSVAPLVTGLASPIAAGDPALAICQRWIAVDAEYHRLLTEWGNLEGWLIKKRRWFRLSSHERAAIPEGARLAEIEARLDVLEEENQTLLKAMRPAPAKSVEAVIANLSVAGCLIFEEDHPEAHGLIVRAVRDLAKLSALK
jgi:hypothetical protein